MNDLRQIKREGAIKPPDQVRDFQRKIYRKAKQEPDFRFYSLYDKIYQISFLLEAYNRVKSNKGSSGLDGISFKDIEDKGLMIFLLDIQQSLQGRTYCPSPVNGNRAYI